MATAVATTETKTVQKEVQEKVVKVELTEDEAKFWYAVTGNIGGNPFSTYRSYATSLRAELANLGMTSEYGKYVELGAVYCKAKKS